MDFAEVEAFILPKLKRELSGTLSYHSVGHVLDVYQAAKQIAKQEHVTGDDLTLLLTAVLFHDSGFLQQQKDHERLSCELAEKYLPEYGYTPEEIERICGMIMATRIPQTPHNLLEQIICDADLDYLGQDDFFKIGKELHKEIVNSGNEMTEAEWDAIQIKFLQQHHYFTATAISIRKNKKEEHLHLLKSKYSNTGS